MKEKCCDICVHFGEYTGERNIDRNLWDCVCPCHKQNKEEVVLKNGYMGEFKGYKVGDTFYPAVKHESDNCFSRKEIIKIAENLNFSIDDTETYLGIVKNGNMDKMFDYACQKTLSVLIEKIKDLEKLR